MQHAIYNIMQHANIILCNMQHAIYNIMLHATCNI